MALKWYVQGLGFGLAICFVVVSGVNIWLLRRGRQGRPAIRTERMWTVSVWGIPLAIAVSALAYLCFEVQPTSVFWLTLVALFSVGYLVESKRQLSRCLRGGLAATSLLLVATHILLFGSASFNSAAVLVNGLWLGLATAMIISLAIGAKLSARQKHDFAAAPLSAS